MRQRCVNDALTVQQRCINDASTMHQRYHAYTHRKTSAKAVSTFCSPKVLSKGLWANTKWKRLVLV
eukprot:8944263-Lingulodinium_polyedra.AAC.1